MERSGVRILLAALWLAGLAPAAVASAQTPARVPAELQARAAAQGSVRVLVELRERVVPDALLPDAAARARQRARIAAARGALLRERDLRPDALRRSFDTLPFVALRVDAAGLDALERSPLVAAVQEDRIARPILDQSVPQVQADLTAALGLDGTGRSVVVLDTGADAAHPSLAGKIVAEACFSEGDCPNGQSVQTGPGAGSYCTWSPDCFHGTHVASIAVGAGPAYPGVAPGGSLVPIQVFSRITGPSCPPGESPCPGSYASDQVAALEHVYQVLRHQHAVASINMSLGGAAYTSQVLCDAANAATKAAIDNLRSVRIPTIIAAGNDGYVNAIGEPACISSAVSVSAVDDSDEIPYFANAAAFLSLWAPGVGITAAYWQGSGFATASGTSMATPHVAGAWAVLKQGDPSASVDDVLGALQATGVPIIDFEAATSRIRILEATRLLFPCSNGIDDDEDGYTDFPEDPGCAAADDNSERDFDRPCDNNEDDDGDGAIDTSDAGCLSPSWPAEDPACDDGDDNDGDGGFDHDGAGLGPADPQCVGKPWKRSEAASACGLGAELVLLLALWPWLRRRR